MCGCVGVCGFGGQDTEATCIEVLGMDCNLFEGFGCEDSSRALLERQTKDTAKQAKQAQQALQAKQVSAAAV